MFKRPLTKAAKIALILGSLMATQEAHTGLLFHPKVLTVVEERGVSSLWLFLLDHEITGVDLVVVPTAT